MVDIYYPYVHKLAKGDELKYSLRSLEQHAKFDFTVTIVGEPPEWIQDVKIIPHKLKEIGVGTCTWDAIQKLKAFLADPGDGDFIRMYDDIYLLQPCSLDDLKTFYTHGDYTGREPDMKNTWGRQLKRTLEILKGKQCGQHNTESHCPEYFNKHRMRCILTWFEPEKEKLLTSTLYSNFWSLDLTPVEGVKAGFYGPVLHSYNYTRLEQIRQICSTHRYMNHNDSGYTPGMIKFLQEKFPDKSRFEK